MAGIELFLFIVIPKLYFFLTVFVGGVSLFVILMAVVRRESMPLWLTVPVWTFVLPGLWIWPALIIAMTGPTERTHHVVVRLEPKSGVYDSVRITELSSSYVDSGAVMIDLQIDGNSRWEKLENIDPVTMRQLGKNYHGQPFSRTVNREFVIQAFRDIGVNTALFAVVDDADEIVALIRRLPESDVVSLKSERFTFFVESTNSGREVPAKWLVALLILPLPVVWLIGLVFLLGWRRHNLAYRAVKNTKRSDSAVLG